MHRSVGLASFVVLVVIAFTGLYMNIPAVVEPALAAVAPFTERPPSVRTQGAAREAVWKVGWDAAYGRARAEHADDPVAGIGRIEARGYYQVRFLPPGDIMDSGTIRYFVDGRDGRLLGRFDHREGTAGDKIRTWQFPLHSGQGFGLAGRILVCVTGLVPLLLAFTGLWLWLRRTRLRRRCGPEPRPTSPAAGSGSCARPAGASSPTTAR
ncbi:MAG: PepSY domain-containing protein [Betaproteobacteria bacterium]|nr:PepSY domain-containing protein [Betaproteobacteria bacterium]